MRAVILKTLKFDKNSCVLMWKTPLRYCILQYVESWFNRGKCDSLLPSSVWGYGASAQAVACQAFEDAHGYVHQRAEVKEQVVEGVHRQTSGFISIFHGYNGCVEAVGQIAESGLAGFNHFLGALVNNGNRFSVYTKNA